jgi:membrane associated rhomboid family serine protease
MIPAPVGYQCPECVAEARKAFRQSPAQRMRVARRLTVTTTIMLILAVVFVVEIVLSKGQIIGLGLTGGGRLVNETLDKMGASSPGQIADGQWWRLLTAMFLHASVLHILLNCWALYLFGQFAEGTFGPARTVAIYLVAGFLASVTSYTFSLNGGVGASGAIMGLLGAFIAYNFRRRDMAQARANLQWAVMIIAINIFFGLSVANVDNWAHGGGLVAGAAAGTVVDGIGPPKWRNTLRWVGMVALVAIGIALTVWRTADLHAKFPGSFS